jgi:hypothetical protein
LSAAIIGLVGRVCGDEPESLPLSRGKESSGRNGRLPAASITGIMICSWMTNRSPFVPISALGSGVRGETLHSGPVLRGEHVHELRFANSTCSVTCLALQLAFDTECRILAGQFAFVVCFAQFASAVLEALQFLAAADICLARASPEASLALEAADIERKDMILMKAVYSDSVNKPLNGIPPK